MSVVGGKLPLGQYGNEVRRLAGLLLVVGALGAAGCEPSHKHLSIVSSTYGANRCGPGPSNWSPQGHEFGELMRRNTLEVDPSNLKWNGTSINAPTLRQYLPKVDQLNPPINLQIVVDPSTDCRRVNQIRVLITQGFHCTGHGIPVCVEYSAAEWQRLRAERRSEQLPE
jgi:hypothetical protein